MVEAQGKTIKKAAILLGVNYSTSKYIVKQNKILNKKISFYKEEVEKYD